MNFGGGNGMVAPGNVDARVDLMSWCVTITVKG